LHASPSKAATLSIEAPGGRIAPVAIAALFFVVGLIGVYHHEMWRDEIEVWLIATDSPTMSDLLSNIATQPHPPLWYMLTWLLARFTQSLYAMQLLSLAIGTASAYLFARYAPLPLFHRALFCFGYFPLYEYTLISRSYGLELFFALLFCVLYTRVRDPAWRYASLAVTLVLMANVHLLGTVVAGLLWLLLAWDVVELARGGAAGWPAWASLAGGAAGIAFGLVEGMLAMTRMAAEHVRRAPFDAAWLEGTLSSIVNAYLPIPDVFQRGFWNTSFLVWLPASIAAPATLGLAFLLLLLSAAALRRSGILLALHLAGTLAMLFVFAEKSSSYLRHHGHLAILFTALLWLAAARGARRLALQGGALVVLGVVLVIHLGGAAFAYGADFVLPFSRSAEASRFLAERTDLRDAVLVGSIDYTSQPFAAYLGRAIYYPDQKRFGTFMTWGPEREVVRYQQVVKQAARLQRDKGQPVVLILDYDPQIGGDGERCRVDDELELEQLASFPCAIVSEESYWLAAMRPFDATLGAPAAECSSRRAWPIGPHVEIPRIQDQAAARRGRRAARRAAAEATLQSPPPVSATVNKRQQRKATRQAHHAARGARPIEADGRWSLAACRDD
jgi:hypothetical protein